MAQFSDLVFSSNDSSFEANYVFDNYFQIHVICGPATFGENSDKEARASAADYNSFEYKIFDGVTQLDDTNWVENNTKEQITAIMADVEGRTAVYSDPGGGE